MTFLNIENDHRDQELAKALIGRTRHWLYSKADTISEGLSKWQHETPMVVLIDMSFPDSSEKQVLNAIKTMSTTCKVIALSGSDDVASVNKARDAGAITFINKKSLTDPTAFHDAITEAIDRDLAKNAGQGDGGELLARLATAVFYGNGKPSLMTRVENIEGKQDAMQVSQDRQFAGIERKLDDQNSNGKWKFYVQLCTIVIFGLLSAYGIYKGTPFHVQMPSVGIEK